MDLNDRAIANLPVDKRPGGNIDRQIDRWKRDQAVRARHEAKAKAAQRREDKRLAKELLTQHLDAVVAHYGPKFGERNVRDMLVDWSKWDTAKLFKFLDEHSRSGHTQKDS